MNTHEQLQKADLVRLVDELVEVAEKLSVQKNYLCVINDPRQRPADDVRLSREELITIASCLYHNRAARSSYFKASLLGEPAWDMLLDLFISGLQEKQISTTSLCIASGVPTTTALRYISALVDHGLASKRPDPHDQRVNLVEISKFGRESMTAYLNDSSWGKVLRLQKNARGRAPK